MWKSVSVLAFAFTLSQSASAALIDNGAYLTDTISGLDWLKLTQTADRSVQEVSLQLGVVGEFAGWQYASGAQFESLLLDQGMVADTGCTDNATFCGGTNPVNYPTIDSLINAIGDTYEQAYHGMQTSDAYASLGILSDSGSYGSSHYLAALVGSSKTAVPNARTHFGSAQGELYHEAHVGSFLIRPSEVPAPAATWLFGSGLIGLTVLARKRKAA